METTEPEENTTHPERFQENMNESKILSLESGYDLPVYGLDTGQFYQIHIIALICIFTSFGCAVAVVISSFTSNPLTFFKWSKSERFVVYLALCDGLFNLSHSMDHLQIAITRDHVRPKELCTFYGFMIAQFVSAQNILVCIIAINAFCLIYFRKHLSFGSFDWRLLFCTFGVPCLAAIAASLLGYFGPSGAFCYFDGVKGYLANLFFTTVPLLTVVVINTVLYILTWQKIKSESKRLKNCLGKESRMIKASHSAAKTMSLFVAVFFIQWWALSVFAIWQLATTHVPVIMFQITIFFTNIGGVLNGAVYLVIRRRRLTNTRQQKLEKTSSSGKVNTIEIQQFDDIEN